MSVRSWTLKKVACPRAAGVSNRSANSQSATRVSWQHIYFKLLSDKQSISTLLAIQQLEKPASFIEQQGGMFVSMA
jgi:hypothetical protein